MAQQYVVKPCTDRFGTELLSEYSFYDEEAAIAMANMLQLERPVGWDVIGAGTTEIIYRAR